MNQRLFFFGEWQVNPESNTIRQGEKTHQLEPRAMDVLVFLCRHANQVYSADDLLQQVWAGAMLGDNPVHKTIAQLRKALGDEASQPRFIETIRKRGYRAIAPVVFPVGDAEAVSEGLWQQGSPFPGLRAFEPKEADVFFGRGEQLSALLKSIAMHIRDGRSLHIVLGPSGSGKTSLVNAGIIPNLLAEHGFDGIHVLSAASVDMADVSESRLFLDMASALLDWEIGDEPVFTGISADVLANELQSNLEKLVTLFTSIMAAQVEQKRYQLLLIDRLEALLSAPQFSESVRTQVVRIMDSFASSGAAIVIATCRNDFYPMLAQHKALMAGKNSGAHFDLLPPSRAELLQMIRLPAKAAKLKWESDHTDSLDQLLCDAAAESPDALPMLQYTLNELYQQRDEDNELKLAHYRALGGIEGAIGKRAETIYNAQPESVKAALPQIFAKLVSLSNDEKSITSRAALWSQLGSEQERQLVQVLVDNRLLVSHLVGDEPGFSLAHEALLRRWPRAVEWIHQHRYNIKIKSRLQLATERWIGEKEAKEFLIPDGKPLFEAKEIQQNKLFSLSEDEQRYIYQSSNRSSVRKLVKRVTVASLALLTLLSVAMTIRSIESEKRAEVRRAQADDLLGFMVGEFADKVRPLGRLDLLGGVSEKALEYLSVNERVSSDTSLRHAKAMLVFAEVSLAKGEYEKAEQTFQRAKNVLHALESIAHPHPGSHAYSQVLKELGIASYWLGTIAYNTGNYERAKPYYDSYLTYSERYTSLNPASADAFMEQAYAHTNLGSTLLKQGEKAAAKNHFKNSVLLSEKALQMNPDNRVWQADQIDTMSWLGSTHESLGELDVALEILNKERQLLEQLTNLAPSEKKWQWLLANARKRQASLLWVTGKLDDAYASLNRSAEAYAYLSQLDPENLEYQSQALSVEATRLQWIQLLGSVDEPDVFTFVEKVKEFKGRLPSISVENTLLRATLIASKEHLNRKNFEAAQVEMSSFFDLLEVNRAKSKNSASRALLELQGLSLKSEIFRAQNKFDEQEEACRAQIESLKQNAARLGLVEYQSHWIRAHVCLNKEETVQENIAALKSIGYQEPGFNQYLTQ